MHRTITLAAAVSGLVLAAGCDDLNPGTAVSGAASHSREVAGEASLKSLGDSIRMFAIDMDRLPTAREGLDVLLSPDKLESGRSNWQGPYLSNAAVLSDRYQNRIIYEVTATGFRLISLGADGERGGTGISADAVYESPGL